MRLLITSAEEVAASIQDEATIAVASNGGGMLEPNAIFAAIEARFLKTGHPRNLTLIHAMGFGDRDGRGASHFAHEGLVRRVIGGHWTWSHKMQRLARDNKIEAYSLPAGVISLLLRESGSGRPGLITQTGLDTFVDPTQQGGRVNALATQTLVERIELDGQPFLRYLPFNVDLALIKGTLCDAAGNISLGEEPVDLDTKAAALAAYNSGGRVIAQVREQVANGAIRPRDVTVPGVMVNALVIHPEQSQTYRGGYDAAFFGKGDATTVADTLGVGEGAKGVIALRAADELTEGAVVNFGFGASAGVAGVIAARHTQDRYWTTVEQGIHGGRMMTDELFGSAHDPKVIVSTTEQFDFYHGGGLDIAFLGMAECDRFGNVNVSHIGNGFIGPGGFIDITQNARKLVFCGTFDTKGSQLDIGEGRLAVKQPGSVRKFVSEVAAVTFSGRRATAMGQVVLFVTERAVFQLTSDGVELIEVAPGIDIERDILSGMDFRPLIRSPRLMNAEYFNAA
ncbi:acyl CoA:acetate/3-ketoacid CoA transferase [Halomonas dongshanensis]|uniref:Acetate CoA-transferase YdiF n=1 Tax=Halomonas dongshanensis TaxID=2890835 RepID=A0ABT2EAY4_9GAMM|nr:CoA-transferase [Halomonas dongshanensis]MCS2608742.1 acyl CoA:acetate/3-ketoacid CoA transferase [Halomonas dongshanensis]